MPRGSCQQQSLCTGAASQSEGAHSRTLMGMEQSDSAQKPELHAICEGLQVYSLQVQTATLLQGQEEAEQSYVAWRILEVLW